MASPLAVDLGSFVGSGRASLVGDLWGSGLESVSGTTSGEDAALVDGPCVLVIEALNNLVVLNVPATRQAAHTTINNANGSKMSCGLHILGTDGLQLVVSGQLMLNPGPNAADVAKERKSMQQST